MEIPRIKNVSTEDIQIYIDNHQPIIVEKYASSWPAVKKWHHKYILDNLDDFQIRYKRSNSRIQPDFRMDQPEQRSESTIKKYFDYMLSLPEAERAYYFLGHIHMFHAGKYNAHLKKLYRDIEYPACIKKESIWSIGTWFSYKGVFSWLHYDDNDAHNLNVQVLGSKHVYLYNPDEVRNLYLKSALVTPHYNFSEINIDEIDHERFPLFRHATCYEGILNPGDMLFIPVHWFHSFKHLAEFNVNVNFWCFPKHQLFNKIFAREQYVCSLMEKHCGHLLEKFHMERKTRYRLYLDMETLVKFLHEIMQVPQFSSYKTQENILLTTEYF